MDFGGQVTRVARCSRQCARLFADCSGLTKKQLLVRFLLCLVPCVAMLVMMTVTWMLLPSADLRVYGIVARTAFGLIGLCSWPFLHFSWSHLASNVFFCLLLGFLLAVYSVLEFVMVFFSCQFIGGVLVWVSGPANVSVIGSSGIILGFFASIIVRAVFERTWSSIFWAVVIILLYGTSIIFALLPGQSTTDGIPLSWQAHLFGFLVGGAVSAILGIIRKKRAKTAAQANPQTQDFEQNPFDETTVSPFGVSETMTNNYMGYVAERMSSNDLL